MFRINGGKVEQLGDSDVLADPFLLDLVQTLRWPRPLWQGNIPPIVVATPTPHPTPAKLPETGGPPMPNTPGP